MKKIGKITTNVVNGNIAAMGVDAVIIPEFDNCASYGGVGGAMARSGAKLGLDEYNKKVQNSPLAYGDALITPSYGGMSKYLLHVATVGSSKEEAFAVTYKAVYKALQLAEEAHVRTLAVPAIGNGIIGSLTLKQSAKAIFRAVADFSEKMQHHIAEITMVIYGSPEDAEPAQAVLDSQSYLGAENEIGQKRFDPIEWMEGFEKDMNNIDR